MTKRIRQIGFAVIMGMLGISVGYLLGSLIPDSVTGTVASETADASSNDLWLFVSLILQLSVIAYTVILIHELGHTFGGYLADYRPYQVTVGVTTIDFSGKYWRLRWNSDPMLAGGISISLSKHNRHSRWRYLTYVVAGPLTTLITGLVSIGIWLVLPVSPFSMPLILFAFMSVAICIATLFPMPMGLLRTDGYRAIKLIWNYDDEARAWIASTDMIAAMVSGQTLKTLDKQLFEHIRANSQDTFSIVYYEYLRALEIGDTDHIIQSAAAFQDMLEDLPSVIRKDVERELAFVYGWIAPDEEQFQRHYQATEKLLKTPEALNYRVIAAHHRMTEQFEDMHETLLTAQQFLQTDRSMGYGSEQVIISRLLEESQSIRESSLSQVVSQ